MLNAWTRWTNIVHIIANKSSVAFSMATTTENMDAVLKSRRPLHCWTHRALKCWISFHQRQSERWMLSKEAEKVFQTRAGQLGLRGLHLCQLLHTKCCRNTISNKHMKSRIRALTFDIDMHRWWHCEKRLSRKDHGRQLLIERSCQIILKTQPSWCMAWHLPFVTQRTPRTIWNIWIKFWTRIIALMRVACYIPPKKQFAWRLRRKIIDMWWWFPSCYRFLHQR